MMLLALLPVAAYLLGSVPFGWIFARRFAAVDVRRLGSGNIGATNVGRVAGARLGLLTLSADLLKGYLPVLLAGLLAAPDAPWREAYVGGVALAAFFGHLYPAYFAFREGGKGVATAAGGLLAVSPASFLVSVAVFILAAGASRRVSLGSLAAAASAPVALAAVGRSLPLIGYGAVLCFFIFLRHRENLKRLREGTEPAFRPKP